MVLSSGTYTVVGKNRLTNLGYIGENKIIQNNTKTMWDRIVWIVWVYLRGR